jgi:hypothetical protein
MAIATQNSKKMPRNPQINEDELKRLNHIWNKTNIEIPGVRILQTKNRSVIDWGLKKKRVVEAYDMFVELWTPMHIFKNA